MDSTFKAECLVDNFVKSITDKVTIGPKMLLAQYFRLGGPYFKKVKDAAQCFKDILNSEAYPYRLSLHKRAIFVNMLHPDRGGLSAIGLAGNPKDLAVLYPIHISRHCLIRIAMRMPNITVKSLESEVFDLVTCMYRAFDLSDLDVDAESKEVATCRGMAFVKTFNIEGQDVLHAVTWIDNHMFRHKQAKDFIVSYLIACCYSSKGLRPWQQSIHKMWSTIPKSSPGILATIGSIAKDLYSNVPESDIACFLEKLDHEPR